MSEFISRTQFYCLDHMTVFWVPETQLEMKTPASWDRPVYLMMQKKKIYIYKEI